MDPGKFGGNYSSDGELWLEKLIEFMSLAGFGEDDKSKIAVFGLFLEDAAEIWYRNEIVGSADANSWMAIKTKFEARFPRREPTWFERQELLELAMLEGETLKNYIDIMRKKFSRLEIPIEERQHYFVRGLHPNLKSFVIGHRPGNLQRAVELSLLAESISQMEKSSEVKLDDMIDQVDKLRISVKAQGQINVAEQAEEMVVEDEERESHHICDDCYYFDDGVYQ